MKEQAKKQVEEQIAITLLDFSNVVFPAVEVLREHWKNLYAWFPQKRKKLSKARSRSTKACSREINGGNQLGNACGDVCRTCCKEPRLLALLPAHILRDVKST